MTFERTPAEWPDIDPATVAPLRNGIPDLYNYLPTRFVTVEEAKARGWKHFYIGQACPHGHKSPRFVSNPNQCVDCKRVHEGRNPIGVKTDGYVPRLFKGHGAGSTPVPRKVVSQISTDPEPDPTEKRFLRAYAEKRDFNEAAKELGRTPGEFQARLSYSKPFREAVEFLEEQYGLAHTAVLTEDFPWTDDKRKVLLRVFVNTGNLGEAIQVIGCTNWDYEQELKDNPEFASAIEAAQDPAKRALEREAVARGLRGNDRLMQAVLEANLPAYSRRMDVNFNVRQLTDEQLNERLFQLLERADGIRLIDAPSAIEGECSVTEPRGAAEADGDSGAEGATETSQSNFDLL